VSSNKKRSLSCCSEAGVTFDSPFAPVFLDPLFCPFVLMLGFRTLSLYSIRARTWLAPHCPYPAALSYAPRIFRGGELRVRQAGSLLWITICSLTPSLPEIEASQSQRIRAVFDSVVPLLHHCLVTAKCGSMMRCRIEHSTTGCGDSDQELPEPGTPGTTALMGEYWW